MGVSRFGRTVSAVRRRRSDDAGCHRQLAINGRNGIAEAVEKQDVFWGNLHSAELIGFVCNEFPSLEQTFGRAVAVTVVILCEIADDFLDPFRDLAMLLDRVADVFPVDLESECL